MATIVKCSSQIQMHNAGSKKDLKVRVALETKQAAVTNLSVFEASVVGTAGRSLALRWERPLCTESRSNHTTQESKQRRRVKLCRIVQRPRLWRPTRHLYVFDLFKSVWAVSFFSLVVNVFVLPLQPSFTTYRLGTLAWYHHYKLTCLLS